MDFVQVKNQMLCSYSCRVFNAVLMLRMEARGNTVVLACVSKSIFKVQLKGDSHCALVSLTK